MKRRRFLSSIAAGLDFAPGDQVLTTNHEHGGGMECWQHARRHRGIEIVYLEMPKYVQSKQQLVDLVRDHITPRTRACSFSHIDRAAGPPSWHSTDSAEVLECERPFNRQAPSVRSEIEERVRAPMFLL